jgi:Uma2 family endonuclease
MAGTHPMQTTLVPEPIRLTYDDFCALPDDGRRYEILDGDLYMSLSPETPHQDIVGNLFAILHQHIRGQKLGRVFVAPLDVLLDEHNIVEPDLIFVSTERRAIITRKNIQGAPDLLVEVLSPSTSKRDLRDKRNVYARSGVRFYWIIDPDEHTLLELQLSGNAYSAIATHKQGATIRPMLFPDLSLDLDSLWE